MFQYCIGQFLVSSNFPLERVDSVCGSDGCSAKVSLCRLNGVLSEFDELCPAARLESGWKKIPGGATRSYQIHNSTLICAASGFRMLVKGAGDEILVEYSENAEEQALAQIHPTGIGLSLCSLFRGWFPLHVAGFELGNQFFCLAGRSGAGKSTTLWEMLDRNCKYVCDDVLSVVCDEQEVWAYASANLPSKLAEGSALRRTNSCDNLIEVYPGERKYLVEIPNEKRTVGRRSIGAIFLLNSSSTLNYPGQTVITKLDGGSAVKGIVENIHGLWAVPKALFDGPILNGVARLVRNVAVYSVMYGRNIDSLPQVAKAIYDVSLAHN